MGTAQSMLVAACENGESEDIARLIQSKADPNGIGENSYRPLHIAAINGRYACIKVLSELGAELDALDYENNTPLHNAVLWKKPLAVETLLALKADPTIKNSRGDDALALAILGDEFISIQLLNAAKSEFRPAIASVSMPPPIPAASIRPAIASVFMPPPIPAASIRPTPASHSTPGTELMMIATYNAKMNFRGIEGRLRIPQLVLSSEGIVVTPHDTVENVFSFDSNCGLASRLPLTLQYEGQPIQLALLSKERAAGLQKRSQGNSQQVNGRSENSSSHVPLDAGAPESGLPPEDLDAVKLPTFPDRPQSASFFIPFEQVGDSPSDPSRRNRNRTRSPQKRDDSNRQQSPIRSSPQRPRRESFKEFQKAIPMKLYDELDTNEVRPDKRSPRQAEPQKSIPNSTDADIVPEAATKAAETASIPALAEDSAAEEAKRLQDLILQKLKNKSEIDQLLKSSAGRHLLYSSVNTVGPGRTGKTCLKKSWKGQAFESTPSTVGLDTDHVQLQTTSVPTGANYDRKQVMVGQSQWSEFDQKSHSREEDSVALLLAEKITSAPPEPPSAPAQAQSEKSISSSRSNPPAPAPSVAVAASVSAPNGPSAREAPYKETPANGPSRQIVTEEPSYRVNESLVLQYAAEKSEPLRLTLLDFGGQRVFLSMHSLFLRRRSVFVLVFNMEWVLPAAEPAQRQETFEMLDFWFKSVALHTRDEVDGTCAPIFVVGTHKDRVTNVRTHEEIGKMLFDRYGKFANFRPFERAEVSTGRGLLWFYPIDNTKGLGDPVNIALMQDIESTIRGESYTKTKVPLAWLKVLDTLTADKRMSMKLSEFETLCAECGLRGGQAEVWLLLALLSELGTVMHHSELVVTNPIEFFVGAVSKFVCDFSIHLIPEHAKARVFEAEWLKLTRHGIISSKLLTILWSGPEYQPHIHELEYLICKFGLMVPLVGDDNEMAEREYLVPAILSLINAPQPLALKTDVRLTCEIIFAAKSMAATWKRGGGMSVKDVKQHGFLPHGVFSRIVGMAVSQSERYCGETMDPTQLQLGWERAEGLAFGDHGFSLCENQAENAIRVEIHVRNTLLVIETLAALVEKVLEIAAPGLEGLFAVRGGESLFCLIFGEHGLHTRVASGRGPPQLLVAHLSETKETLETCFRDWLPPSGLLSRYDAFLSYRWDQFDSELVAAVFYQLSRKNIRGAQVQVFLDRQRLQGGSNFVTDFMAAMLSSTVVVPVVSIKSFDRMFGIRGDEESADNVLLEWTLALELRRQDRIAAIQPVLVGNLDETGMRMSNLFGAGVIERLPAVISQVSVKTVSKFISDRGMTPTEELATLTVRETVQCLTKFLGTILWDIESSHGVNLMSSAISARDGGPALRYKRKLFRVASDNVMGAISKNAPASAPPAPPSLEVSDASSAQILEAERRRMEAELAARKAELEVEFMKRKLETEMAAQRDIAERMRVEAEQKTSEEAAKKKSKTCTIL